MFELCCFQICELIKNDLIQWLMLSIVILPNVPLCCIKQACAWRKNPQIHRCQHQRTKKRDRQDEKAWKAVVSIFHHQGVQLVLWYTTSSSLATQTRRQRPSAGCAWQCISRMRSLQTSPCGFRSQQQHTYWCCPNVTEPLHVCCPVYVTLHTVSSVVADTKIRIACYTV